MKTNLLKSIFISLILLVGGISKISAETVTFTADDILFFNMSAVSWWTAGTNGNGNFAYFYNNSTGINAWSAHAVQYSRSVYYVKIPAGTWEGVILTRNNTSTAPSWNNKWNQTGDIALSSTSNYISKFSENSATVTWDTQKPTSTGSLAASATSVNIGSSVTLTPSLTSNTTYNEIKSTSYSISPSSGASISSGKFTATQAGTYTVTATVTYNPRGYSSLTSEVIPTVTITVNPWTITWNPNGGSVTPTSSTYDGATAVSLPTPTRTGYNFDGWYTAASGGTKINDIGTTTKPTSNVTYYAHWTPKTYTITLDKNDGASNGSATATYNSNTVAIASQPTRTDYRCDGYYTDASCTTLVLNIDGTLAKNVSGYTDANGNWTKDGTATLYAKWIYDVTEYTVTFGAGTGFTSYGTVTAKNNSTSATITSPATVRSGQSITFTADPKTGYVVEGWYTNAACTAGKHNEGKTTYTTSIIGTTNVYVKFVEKTWSVAFTAGTGGTVTTPSSTPQPVGEVQGITIIAETKEGYNFDGWTSSNGGKFDDARAEKTTFYPTAATTVTASFTENLYAITVKSSDNNHGTVSQSTDKAGIATTITITATPEDGYRFVNWTATNGITIAAGNSTLTTVTATAAGTVTANFEKIPDKIVYLKPNGNWKSYNARFAAYAFGGVQGNAWYDMIDVGCSGEYYYCEIPAKYTSVIFVRMNPANAENKWNNNGQGPVWTQTGDLTIEEGKVFTIIEWESGSWGTYSAPQYAITITNGTGGTVTVKQGANTITSGNKVNLNAVITATLAANDGYSKGTAKIKIGDNAEADLVEGQEYTICGPTTIAATWKPDTHTVTFDANGHGTAPDEQSVDHNEKVTEPEDPTAEGFTFGGWYTDAECTTPYDFNTTVSSSFTLYAKWIQQYVIVGSGNGTSGSQEMGSWLNGHSWIGDGSVNTDQNNIIQVSKTYEDCPAGIKNFRIVRWGTWDTDYGYSKLKSCNVPYYGNQDENIVFVTIAKADITIGFDGTNITVNVEYDQDDLKNVKNSIVSGEKVMFYFGDEWSVSDYKYVKDGNENVVTATKGFFLNGVGANKWLSVAVLPSKEYYITNGAHGVNTGENVQAGAIYACRSGSVYADIPELSKVSGVTPTWNNPAVSVKVKTNASGLSATVGNSSVNRAQTITDYYYQKEGESTWTKFNPEDVSDLHGGIYKVHALACDGNIYVRTAEPATLTIYSTITFDQEGGEGGTETLNATYGEATTPITTPTKTGYTFRGYWTEDNGTGTQIVNTDGTWIENKANFTDENNKWIVESNKTLYAKWEENFTTITIKTSPTGAGALKVDGNNFTVGNKTTVGITTLRTVVASNTDGFTFKEWQKSDNITITEGSLTSPSITIKGNGNGGAGTLTAVYDEDLSTPYVFKGGTAFGGDDWVTEYPLTKRPGESNVNIGYVTFNITGINTDGSKRAYQFKIKKGDTWYGLPANGNWWYMRDHSTEARSLSSSAGDIGLITDMAGAYTIKVDYTNENDPKLTVSYPSTEFYLLGFGNANSDWAEDESKKFSVDAGIATITKTLMAGDHEFKIKEKVNNNEIWRTSSTTITRSNNTNIDFSNTTSGSANAKITADVAGTYTFKYDVVDQQLTVIYPSKLILTDGSATSVSSAMTSNPLTTVPGQMVTATPTMDIGANGNTLCWKLYDKDQDINNLDETVDVNFISLGNGKITFELPKVTGTYYLQLTIHAGADCSDETLIETIICPISVSTENTVFFQDESGKWKNVYVYFYGEGGYWEDAYGSGATNITSHKMTRINGTNIFYYKYSFDISSKNIAFTDHDQAGYQWFSSCQVVYRSDFDDCVPMFVLDKNHGVNRNTTAYYYTDGYWTTYMGTSSGYWLHISGNGVTDPNYEMTTTTVGKRVYTHKVSLNGNQNPYNLWFGGCNGTNYGVESNMTVTNCTEWNLYAGPASVNLHATASGDYTFILYCNPDGHFQLSVEFPVAKGDFQLIYDDEQQNPHPSDYIRSSTVDGKLDTVSMYIRGKNGTGKTLKVQRCTGFSNNGNPQWETLKTYDDAKFSGLNLTKDTVYNFHMKQTVSGNTKTIAIEGTEFYSGKYYVRTKAADGGWDAYATEADNQMTYTEYSSHLPFDPYTHYFCKWVDDSKDDVSYTVACDYAKALSDTLEGDNYTVNATSHALPEKANVRFTYDNRTNGLKRAYLTGASDSNFDDFLKLTKTKDGTTMKPGKNASDVSHVKLKDEENWVYATEIYVTSGGYSFDAMLTAVYPKSAVDNPAKKQYFFAKKNNDGTYAGETLIGGTDGSEQLVTIRYDFKTNRLMRAWKPSGEIDDEELPLSADILLIREGQNAAEQLVFSDPTANKITDVKTIFGALEFKYDNMVGKLGTGNWDKTSYHYCRYYVSFPFDVRISEIFGAGNYGEDYIIQKYNGTKRAEIGWFAETETFWETMDKSEKLNKYEGYCVMLNRTPFNDGNSHVWKNKKTGSSVYLYFPSASHKDDWTINATGDVVITVPAHQCNIDRYFTQDLQLPYPRNHKNTDSHWNMVGTPLFQNATAAKIADDGPLVEEGDGYAAQGTRLQYVYDWVNTVETPNGTAARKAWGTDFEFKAMHSYLIQYAGQVTFQGSHIANHVPTAIAARRVAEEVKNYTVELQLDRDSAFASRTYVELQENAVDSFLLNEDMYMGSSSPIANLYTYAGAYDVAANVLSINSHIVPVGVQVKQAGTYTFSMTTPFDGTVTLIDYHTGSRTNLGWSDYTVTLEKGTFNDRFALEINIQHVSTDVEGNTGNFKGKDGVKFLHNGILYIKKGDAIYDARGSKVSMSYEL